MGTVPARQSGTGGPHVLGGATCRWVAREPFSSWRTAGPASRRQIGSGSSIRSLRPRIRAKAPGSDWRLWRGRFTKAAGSSGWTGHGRGGRCSRFSSRWQVETMRLLIVDDDAGLRHSLALLLQEAGYEVAAEGDPEEALTRAAAESFDLILCDV